MAERHKECFRRAGGKAGISLASEGRASLGLVNCPDFRNVHLHRAKTSPTVGALSSGRPAPASRSVAMAGVGVSLVGVLA